MYTLGLLDWAYFAGRCISSLGWGVGREKHLWAQAPQVIRETLRGAQPRPQSQRVGGTEQDEKRGEWRQWRVDGVGGVGDSKKNRRLFGVRRHETEGCEGQRQRRWHGRKIVGKSKCFLICSSVFPARLQVSQICLILALCAWCQICEVVMGNPWLSPTCLFHYCSHWWFRCSRAVLALYSAFLLCGCHTVDQLEEELFRFFFFGVTAGFTEGMKIFWISFVKALQWSSLFCMLQKKYPICFVVFLNPQSHFYSNA